MAGTHELDPARVARTLTAFRMRRPWQPIPLDVPVPVEALPTPSLLVDVDQLERNLAHMAAHLGARGKGVRAHAKMHKSPIIALRQLDAPAWSTLVTCVVVTAGLRGLALWRNWELPAWRV